MTFTPFLVANYKTGLDREVEPWLLPGDAFSVFQNAYLRRGVITKRRGIQVFRRFISDVGNIIFATQANPVQITQLNHGFVSGQVVFIHDVGGMTQINGNDYIITVLNADNYALNGIDGTGFNAYTSGGISSVYRTEPIMGLKTYIAADGSNQLCVFNTRTFAYVDNNGVLRPYNATNYDPVTNRYDDIFTGSNADFFWTENYRSSVTNTDNKLYITNYVDPIHTWDGTSIVPFYPQYGANPSDIVNRCKLIFAFKQRLVLLSTEENGTLRPQRARWCQAQNPLIWRDDIPGQGGFVDAPTGDFIIGAEFLKDVIIVQCTNSWWTLRPTNDPALPFRWDKITDNRPVNAPFAALSYDKSVTGIGQGGYCECNGVEVSRIDQKIPDFVNELNQDNFAKCYAARYLQEYQTWTLYPSLDNEVSNEALVLNEQEGAWSIYDMYLSCLGFMTNKVEPTWQDYQAYPGDPSGTLPPYVWVAQPGEIDFSDQRWNSGILQTGTNLFIGGGHDGVIYILDTGSSEAGGPINMELLTNNWNPYKEQGIGAQLGYIDFFVDADPETNIEIQMFVNNESAPYKTQKLNFIPEENYVGNVNNIFNTNPVQVFINNHNLDTGMQIVFYQIEGMTALNGNTFTVTRIGNNSFSLDGIDGTSLGTYTGNGIAVKGYFEGLKTWKRAFSGVIGYGHTFKIINNSTDEVVRIHAIMPWFRPAGNRMITL